MPAPPTPPLEQTLRNAFALHRQGKLAQAERLYETVLQADSGHFDALNLLGAVRQQQCRHAEAVRYITQALERNPRHAEAHNNLGSALNDLKRHQEAIAHFQMAIALKPGFAEAHGNLAIALIELERHAEAAAACRKALAIDPDFAKAHYNLGNALSALRREEEAVASYRRAVALVPGDADGHFRLGRTLHRLARDDEAVASLERALAVQPDHAAAHLALGNTLATLNRQAEAIASYQRAVAIDPGFAIAHNNLGNALTALGRYEEAIASYRRRLAIEPEARTNFNLGVALGCTGRLDDALACWRQAMLLAPEFSAPRWALAIYQVPQMFGAGDDVDAARAAFARELSALGDWFGPERSADGFKAVGSTQPFYLAYQERNNRDLLSAYGALCVRLMKVWQDRQGLAPDCHAAGPRIRVGIVSAHIRTHSVWQALIRGWLQHLDRDRFELHVFPLGGIEDQETKFAKAQAAQFEPLSSLLRSAVGTLLAHRPDVLIYPEVGMDGTAAKLASLRLAPVQIAAWGHPETTGLPTIDYYLSAEDFEPADAAQNYSERLVPLPRLGCCSYPPPGDAAAPDLAGLGIAADVPLLICPGMPFKYSPQHDRVFVQIARRLGRCRLVFFVSHMSALSAQLRERLERAFAQEQLKFGDYGVFIPWQAYPEFRGLLKRADVFLDTIGFSGFNTAMQAVQCGLPIVTREGRFMRGRLASGILKRMGLPELVAASDEDYVDLAVRLAQDPGYRQQIRGRIETSRNRLFGDVAPVRALEEFLITACGQH